MKIWWTGPLEGPDNKQGKVKPRSEVGAAVHEQGKSPFRISKEYKDLRDVFSEKRSHELPPYRPTKSSIEILLGAKLSKPKLYLMSPKELKELHPL